MMVQEREDWHEIGNISPSFSEKGNFSLSFPEIFKSIVFSFVILIFNHMIFLDFIWRTCSVKY